MTNFKKFAIAVATASTMIVAAAAPASAAQWWEKAIVQGVGAGIAFGVTNAILNPKTQTIVVAQPSCYPAQQVIKNQWGQVVGYQNVQVCQ